MKKLKLACVALFLVHVWREAIDELVFTEDYHLRSAILTYSMLGAYLSVGLWVGWRTGRVMPGGMAAMLASWSGWIGGILVGVAFSLLRIDKVHPGWIEELFLRPILTLPIAVTLGLVGQIVQPAAARESYGVCRV